MVEHQLGDYDVLKVAHHGSRNSSANDFLEVVHANVSLISCGVNNRYGHPHQETIERLEASGSAILTTSECGAVIIDVGKGGEKAKVFSFSCCQDRKLTI
jgi:competence protein ComEC